MKISKNSVTFKWLVNTMGIILLIFAIVEIVLIFVFNDYYYEYANNSVQSKMNVVISSLSRVAQSDSVNYSEEIISAVENFDEKDRMEIMAIDTSGNIVITSSGFAPEDNLKMEDFNTAVNSQQNYSYSEFFLDTGEKVLAVTSLIPPVATTDFMAIRMITSLENIDKQITYIALVITLIFVVVIVLIGLTGLYFINSIVSPLREIGVSAKLFAKGDFSKRIEHKKEDEIGELCEAINSMAQDLSNAEEIKNDFISSVSHELRTPLTAIKGWSETIYDMDDVEITKKGMKVISNETARLSQMVEELLDFSRMQNGKLTLSKDTTDILAELGEAVLIYEVKAESERKFLTYTEPEMLPFVYGDKNRLKQVFINIIDNAIKYTNEGDSIEVSVFEEDGFINIIVADTGLGISETDLQKVKVKFYKANHQRRGSGIGLAVADEIISMHGGELIIESEENVGTTVLVTLPVIAT